MTFKKALSLALVSLSCAACGVDVAFGEDCSHTAPRQASLDAAGATHVVIDAGAGSLDVIGAPGATELEAKGTACADRESVLRGIELVATRSGDTLRLETRFPENLRRTARLDLEVALPADVSLAVHDGSGGLSIRGVASLEIEDGSGPISVADVAGAATVEDGSGEIELLGVGGDVTIDDGSGAIEIRGAGGRVRITDNSGDIDVRDVDGDVIVEDGSGPMTIAGVGGSVVVEEDGSGHIRVEDVRGDLRVEDDGSGGVDFDGIDGRVSIEEN